MAETGATAWRWLIAGEFRAFPMRFVLAGVAIAIGVALAFAVHLINRSAAESFGQAVRSAAGGADLQVRSTSALGFNEELYPKLMALGAVADASPVVQLRATIRERAFPITLLGLDMFRTQTVSPSLVIRPRSTRTGAGTRSTDLDALLDPDALYLSRDAMTQTGLEVGDRVEVRANGRAHNFVVAGDLPGVAPGQGLAVIDIASAQWRFGRLGTLDRVDLKLEPGTALTDAQAQLSSVLPASAQPSDAETESRRGDALSRAYRVNLDMLALVALLTGGFLVYSAQSLAVTRRLRQFALLRTLGLQERALAGQLLGEGAALGVVGALIGLAGGYAIAGVALRLVGGDLGAGFFEGAPTTLAFAPEAAVLFFAFGVATALAGSYVPARRAARIAPALALKDAGDQGDPRQPPSIVPAGTLIGAGSVCALLPAMNRLPVFGYLAVGLVLAGGVAAMPWLARRLLRPLGRAKLRVPAFEMALGRLLGALGQASIALGGIVASTGLMIAMAVMVTSFRGSVDEWLESFLSADLYVAAASNEPLFDAETQRRLAVTPGVAGIAFSKGLQVRLDPELPPASLIVRPVTGPGYTLPLIQRASRPGDGVALWLSEPAARLYSTQPGDAFALPIGAGGAQVTGYVAGIWRDYARPQGAIVIDTRDYTAITGDAVRSEAAVELVSGASPAAVRASILAQLPPDLAGRVDFAEPAALRARALRLFDRSFAITYALEAIAILIGLAGVAATFSAQTVARIKEFGMMRHVGMSRGQIVAMLAIEGALLGLVGMAAGIAIGIALSQILIHVINPQSFNWTMTTRIPWGLILGVATALIATAAVTAMIAGRQAVSRDAVRAVSEDW
ncbi:FtsX-like permease family protein [Microvirga massiliensis]|uniref:FtsX-like permease family protein n=1 Tax=Microvirga massiliensis TaxID=1033741 RepID=UPI00062B60E6|nr:ABC transporter permease [Microvirga massiliensis]